MPGGGSKAGATVRMVSDDKLETLPRNQVCRAAGEIFAQRHHSKWNKLQIGSMHNGKQGEASSAVLRVYEHPMSTGRRIYISDGGGSFRSGEPKTVFEPHDSVFAGEGNDQAAVEGSSDGNPFIHQVDMESQIGASAEVPLMADRCARW